MLKCTVFLETMFLPSTGRYIYQTFSTQACQSASKKSDSQYVTCHRVEFNEGSNQYLKLSKGNGDGTVNRRSLLGCGSWTNIAAQGNHKVHQREFSGVDHGGMIKQPEPINYILKTLTGDQDYPRENEYVNLASTSKIRLF